MSPSLPPRMPPPVPPEPEEEQEAITVQIDQAYEPEVDGHDLVRAVLTALEIEGHPEGEVTVVVTSDEEVQALNRQYRDVDTPTDVLSFPAQEPAPGFVSSPEADAYLGDIIIAFPFTQRQAAALKRALRDELRLLVIHGTLHLLGYDHATPEEESRMWARQDTILARLEP